MGLSVEKGTVSVGSDSDAGAFVSTTWDNSFVVAGAGLVISGMQAVVINKKITHKFDLISDFIIRITFFKVAWQHRFWLFMTDFSQGESHHEWGCLVRQSPGWLA